MLACLPACLPVSWARSSINVLFMQGHPVGKRQPAQPSHPTGELWARDIVETGKGERKEGREGSSTRSFASALLFRLSCRGAFLFPFARAKRYMQNHTIRWALWDGMRCALAATLRLLRHGDGNGMMHF